MQLYIYFFKLIFFRVESYQRINIGTLWLPCWVPCLIVQRWGLVGPVSVYYDWARWQLSELTRPRDVCWWDVKQPTKNKKGSSSSSSSCSCSCSSSSSSSSSPPPPPPLLLLLLLLLFFFFSSSSSSSSSSPPPLLLLLLLLILLLFFFSSSSPSLRYTNMLPGR